MTNEQESLNIQQVIDLLVKVRDKEGPNIKVVYIHSNLLCDYPDIAIDNVYSISVLEHPITNNKIVSLYCD
jgi:hypothetical protein